MLWVTYEGLLWADMDAATPPGSWGRPARCAGKSYWVTESGAFPTLTAPALFPANDGRWQGVLLAARFLNDLNHGVDTWVWFIGAWVFDTQMLGGKTGCEKGCGAKCGGTLPKKSGKIFRVGIFLDFVWLTTRTPHGEYVRRAKRTRIDPPFGGIERLATGTSPTR